MEELEKKLKNYLHEVTGMKIALRPHGMSHLPFFMTRLYELVELRIGAMKYLAVYLNHEDEFTPTQFVKHLSKISDFNTDNVCVVAKSLPSYVRRRMIEKGLSFVVPNVQMYLPGMGMELRSRAGIKKNKKVESLSPATQVVLIHWLLGRMTGPVSPLELSKELFYSPMTMSRALDELEAMELGSVERVGRERLLTFPLEKETVWKQMLSRFKNPVRSNKRIAETELFTNEYLPAGFTALSKQTMIGETEFPEYAISGETWKNLEKKGVRTIPLKEYGTCVLQVWRYDPRVLEVDGMVDPFSLYLSMNEDADERVESALEEMLGRYL